MFESYSITKYTIRAASKIQVVMFSNNIAEFYTYSEIVKNHLLEMEYVSDEWKGVRFSYGKFNLDEFLSQNGHDLHPSMYYKIIANNLRIICTQLQLMKLQRRTYYLRHFKPLLEDGIELIYALRKML
jgi:hypothetical protein